MTEIQTRFSSIEVDRWGNLVSCLKSIDLKATKEKEERTKLLKVVENTMVEFIESLKVEEHMDEEGMIVELIAIAEDMKINSQLIKFIFLSAQAKVLENLREKYDSPGEKSFKLSRSDFEKIEDITGIEGALHAEENEEIITELTDIMRATRCKVTDLVDSVFSSNWTPNYRRASGGDILVDMISAQNRLIREYKQVENN